MEPMQRVSRSCAKALAHPTSEEIRTDFISNLLRRTHHFSESAASVLERISVERPTDNFKCPELEG
jgi:hypothetical protein